MKNMTKQQREDIERTVSTIMETAVSEDYAKPLLEQYDETSEETLMDAIVSNVMECSAWDEEGVYSDSDIRFAIGRELCARLGAIV